MINHPRSFIYSYVEIFIFNSQSLCNEIYILFLKVNFKNIKMQINNKNVDTKMPKLSYVLHFLNNVTFDAVLNKYLFGIL